MHTLGTKKIEISRFFQNVNFGLRFQYDFSFFKFLAKNENFLDRVKGNFRFRFNDDRIKRNFKLRNVSEKVESLSSKIF